MKSAGERTNRPDPTSVDPQKPARKNLLGKWGLLGLLILAALMIGIPFYLHWASRLFLDFGYGSTASLEKVHIQIGGHDFFIPKAYIWDRQHWHGGVLDGVNMHATLSGFQPYSEETKTEFRPGGRKIIFSLANTPGFSIEKDFNSFKSYYAISQDPHQGPYGFSVYDLKSIAPANELLVRKRNDGELYFLKCYKLGSKPFPSCETNVSFEKNLMVKYHFPLAYLEDWEQIDTGIRELIRSFERPIPF